MLVNELCHVAGSFNESYLHMQFLDMKLRQSMLYLYSFVWHMVQVLSRVSLDI